MWGCDDVISAATPLCAGRRRLTTAPGAAHSVQTGCAADEAFYGMVTESFFTGAKRPVLEANHSPPPNSGVNEWSYTSAHPIRLHEQGLIYELHDVTLGSVFL